MAEATPLEVWDQFARHSHRRLEVDAQGTPDLLLGEALELARGWKPRVGDEDVDLAGLLEQRQRLPLLGEIADDDLVTGTGQLAGQRLELVGLARAQHHARAARCQGACDRSAEAAGCAGQQRRLAVQIHAPPT